jgi:hypothetical protein
MLTSRRAVAHSVPSFGRRAQMVAPGPERRLASGLGDDLRLFALTFTAGFLFVSVYLA